jgi:hypothetical protein
MRYDKPGKMPDIAIPNNILNAIICFHVCTNAVHKVMIPKQNVMKANQILGPNVRHAMVEGS